MFFARPENLYWLLTLVPMVGAAIWYVYWQAKLRDEIGDPDLVEAMASSRSRRLRAVRLGLVIAGVGLLCLAAAQPKWGRSTETIDRSGIDLVFGLDLSKSMLARDIPPTRLQAATGEIETVLDRLDGDRVGMVVFTSVSFVQSPLTTDYGALRFYLDKLDPSDMSVGGTAIGSALRDSVELLTGESFDDSESQATRNAKIDRAENQVVVLITDGEDHASNPVSAAETARKRGIRVVTVGVGGEEGAKIPIERDDGEVRGYKRDKQGELVKSALQEEQLRKIADAGGGEYIRHEGKHSVADRLTSFADELEASRLESEVADHYHDRYHWFVLPALLLLIASFLLGERSTGFLGWGGRTSTSTLLFGILLVAPLTLTGCNELFRAQHPEVERGIDALEAGDSEGALKSFEAAEEQLESPPSRLDYNRGLAHLDREEFDDAREAFGSALGSDDPGLRFDAHYSTGLTYAREEKWKEAVESHERALELHARHPEAISDKALRMARHNLELAYRHLYPPCQTEEDELEENDSPEQATRLKKKPSREDLTLCGLDDDWFAVSAVPGAEVSVEATFRKLGEHDDPEHTFLPNHDDLELELYGAEGEEKLASDDRPEEDDDGEVAKERGPVTRSLGSFTVDENTPLGSNSELLVRVAAADKLKFSYDISIDVEPPCRALEEKQEPNDARSQAATLEAGSHRMQMCAGDPDWFHVTAEMGDTLFVDVKPTARKGSDDQPDPEDLEVSMFDAESGRSLGEARREGPFWTAGVQEMRRDREFHIRVTANDDDVETPYELDIYQYAPCMIGDDRHEENDSLSEATTFEKPERHHRYLRLCPDDDDFYAFRPPKKSGKTPNDRSRQPKSQSDSKPNAKPEPLRLGLKKVPEPSPSDPEVSLKAYDPSNGEVRATGEEPDGATSPTGRADDNDQSQGMDFDRVLTAEASDPDQPIPVGVSGERTFYHLSKLGGDSQNDGENDQNDQQNNDQQDQSDPQNQGDQENQNDQQNQNDEQDQQQENSEQDESQDRDQRSPSDESDRQKEREREKSAREQRTEDILNALEETDENFQMRKALEDNERKRGDGIDKDW